MDAKSFDQHSTMFYEQMSTQILKCYDSLHIIEICDVIMTSGVNCLLDLHHRYFWGKFKGWIEILFSILNQKFYQGKFVLSKYFERIIGYDLRHLLATNPFWVSLLLTWFFCMTSMFGMLQNAECGGIRLNFGCDITFTICQVCKNH